MGDRRSNPLFYPDWVLLTIHYTMKIFWKKNNILNRLNLWIVGTMLFSVCMNFYLHYPDYNKMFAAIVAQFIGSLILGYVISMFIAKYKKNDWKKIWLKTYIVMVVIILISLV